MAFAKKLKAEKGIMFELLSAFANLATAVAVIVAARQLFLSEKQALTTF